MYIIIEDIRSDDPRLDERMVYRGDFWHYNVRYIAPEHESDVYIKWLKHEILDEAVAKCYKFVGAVNNEVTVVANAASSQDNPNVQLTSSQTAKSIVFLSQENITNTVLFLKAAARFHIKLHLQNKEVETALDAELDKCATIADCQMFMATYFDLQFTYTVNKEKNKKFQVSFDLY